MECNDLISKNPAENPNERKRCGNISLLQGDELLVNKILSRDSSKGFSSHIYYRPAEGVPFKWEKQPGTPKHPAMKDCIPLLSPPPAVISSGMPKPCIDISKGSTRSRIWFWSFWKKSKKVQGNKMSQIGANENIIDQEVEYFDFLISDGECISSPCNSSSSSHSSSFNNCSSRPMIFPVLQNQKERDFERKRGSQGIDWPLSCTPWNFTGTLVCMAKRI